MASHKKFNFQGLAGVVLLVPVLCMFYLKETKSADRVNCMPLYVGEKIPPSKLSVTLRPLVRNYRDVSITGDSQNDTGQIKLGREMIRNIMDSKDTVNGVRFCFKKNAKYNEFIQALDVCAQEKACSWVVEKNYLYIFNYIRPDRKYEIIIEDAQSWSL